MSPIRLAAALLSLGTALLDPLVAQSAPPQDRAIDPEIAAWFRSLRNPNLGAYGGVCCDQSDGRVLRDDEWRIADAGYEVLIEGQWREVPEKALLAHMPNPTGGAVLFSYRGEILCFVRPSEG